MGSEKTERGIPEQTGREKVLDALAEDYWTSKTDVEIKSGVGHSQLAVLLNDLENKGIIERKVGDAINDDGRSVLYRIKSEHVDKYEKQFDCLTKLNLFKIPEELRNDFLILSDVNFNKLLTGEEMTQLGDYLENLELSFWGIKSLLIEALDRKQRSLPGKPNKLVNAAYALSGLADRLRRRSVMNGVADEKSDPVITQLLNKYLKCSGFSMSDVKELDIYNPNFVLVHQLEGMYKRIKKLPLTLTEKELFDRIDLYKPRLGDEEGKPTYKRRKKKLNEFDGKGNITIIQYDSELEYIYRRLLESKTDCNYT